MNELKFDFNFTKYINSKFKHIVYQDDIHAYYNLELDIKLISVTQALKKFEPVFNKEYWLKTKARERGISVQELEKEWDTLKQEGCDKGTMYHNYIEKRFNREVFKNKIEVIENYLSQCTDISVANEIVVGNDILAGRFDNLSLRDDRLVLKDYKGLALDTIIPTKSGWSTIENIKVGDEIFDGNGKITKVSAVSNIHYNPCYKIIFDTNNSIICDHEHRWVVTKKKQSMTLTALEMYEMYQANLRPRLRIKCTSLKLEEAELPIDPYVLGVWLADGNSNCGTITNLNSNVWKEIESRGYHVGNNLCDKQAETRTIFGIYPELKKLGLLKNKHIPDIYYRSSHQQRLDLLRGFMDGDGYFNRPRKRCVTRTTKSWQMEAFVHLISSLGYKPTVFNVIGSGFGKTNIPMFDVAFSPKENPFLARNNDYEKIMNKINYNRSEYRYIKSIELIDTVPTKCLSVDSLDCTYLVGKECIKTHNTNKKFATTSKHKLTNGLSHLPNTEFHKYSLQLSLYKYMLGIDCDMEVIWFNGDEYQIFEIPYLEKEVEIILNKLRNEDKGNNRWS